MNDILWVSRLESGGMPAAIERCDGIELARSVVDAARHYIRRASTSRSRLPTRLRPLRLTQTRCPGPDEPRRQRRQVLAGRRAGDAGDRRRGPRLRYVVRDEGLGVPPSEHRRIFEKFYRLDPDLTRGVGGTGLGLYISRELLERMGGRIWVESSGTGGSTFVAELPLA